MSLTQNDLDRLYEEHTLAISCPIEGMEVRGVTKETLRFLLEHYWEMGWSLGYDQGFNRETGGY